MSVKELASLLDMNISAVGLMERGERGVTAFTCYKLSVIFGVSYDTLFNPVEDNPVSGSSLDAARKKISGMINILDEKELAVMLSVFKGIYELRGREEKDMDM